MPTAIDKEPQNKDRGALSRATLRDIARCYQEMEEIKVGLRKPQTQPPSYLVRNGAATPDELGQYQKGECD